MENRELRFRAWFHKSTPTSNGDFMLYSLGVRTDGVNPRVSPYPGAMDSFKGFWSNVFSFRGRVTVMQWTGLTDKNALDVYEGDIVMVINYLNGKPWEGHIHSCIVEAVPGGWELKDHWCHESLRSSSIEVIGNKFENPELMGETR